MPNRDVDIGSMVRAVREELDRLDRESGHPSGPMLERVKEAISNIGGSRIEKLPVDHWLQVLRDHAENGTESVHFYDVGTVQHVGSGVATLSGFPQARTDELVVFPTGAQGMVLNLDQDRVEVILLGLAKGIQGGDLVTRTGRRVRVPVGRSLLGRVVDATGQPMDGRGPIDEAEWRHLERAAPSIIARAPVVDPLQTGTKVIDALVPIGRGQRELIIGDRQIGKTTLAVDAMVNQGDQGVICVYVAIGQRKSATLEVIETLQSKGVMGNSIVVMSNPDDPPALRYIAPYAGCSMAEYFVDAGHDVLIVYDDLSKHAEAYRELSLLLRRPPGREAYPGDVFYLHARLLERACKLGAEAGGGSLTALPIIETRSGNISAYIPTNVIAITDGQIVLSADLFNRGVKPAVNVGLSVSRVGGAAQKPAMRQIAGNLRLELAQFDEVSRFARFGAEVDESTRQQIERGLRVRAALMQGPQSPLSLAEQVLILMAVSEGFLDHLEVVQIRAVEEGLAAYVRREQPDLYFSLDHDGVMTPEMHNQLAALFAAYMAQFLKSGSMVGDSRRDASPKPEGVAQ